MGQKTMIGGTAYDMKSGKCLVNGTAYAIQKGRTLINGTGYDIKLQSGETWLLNDPIAYRVAATCNFVSNGTQFIGITSRMAMFQMLAYIRPDGTYADVFNLNTGRWVNQAYRTLEFDEAPSGELLSWLEQNGTRI